MRQKDCNRKRMTTHQWIKDCEEVDLNPYKEATEMSVVAVHLGDHEFAKEMSQLAIKMMELGYHKAVS